MRLNHYMTKSCEEFYSRICGSRYFFKYFGERKKSPALFVDCIDELSEREDRRMIPFAEELASGISHASTGCNTEFEAPRCPNHLMEGTLDDGFLQLIDWRTSNKFVQDEGNHNTVVQDEVV